MLCYDCYLNFIIPYYAHSVQWYYFIEIRLNAIHLTASSTHRRRRLRRCYRRIYWYSELVHHHHHHTKSNHIFILKATTHFQAHFRRFLSNPKWTRNFYEHC